ncbi:CARDB domain-containing protein [Halorubrum ezzemoulense]|uniref:CARDB domain-containing protein n=1 Tax=Halorubrum ezzemoulense TaxID=337243 RepID=UPI00232C54FF|nr:CARDB domain-containing protein [Halorubrum ezzemoulense]MDB9235643.1 CARDB domain-containing protein [Halorubrum ezzemoulense]
MSSSKASAVLFAVMMLLAPIAGATGSAMAASPSSTDGGSITTQGSTASLEGGFTNATEGVSIYERAALPLQLDRSGGDAIATSTESFTTILKSPSDRERTLRSAGNRSLVVYDANSTVDFSFNINRTGGGDIDGDNIHLIAARAESSDDPSLPSLVDIQDIGDFVEEEADNENIVFENASTSEVTDGTTSFGYNFSGNAGGYVFMAVRTDSGSGVNVSDGNIAVDGQVSVLGADTAFAQQTASDITVDNEEEVGDNITFEVDAGLQTNEDQVEHVVALWNESDVSDETLTIVAPDEINSDTTASDFAINHTIETVAGVQNVEDDVSAFGRNLETNRRGGVFELADIVTFIANEGEFGEPETNRVDTSTINASMTAVNATTAETNITVETLESFEPGEYVAVHMAVADGNLTKLSSDRVDVTLEEREITPATFNVTSLATENVSEAGDPFDVNATIENVGDREGTQTVNVSYDGEAVSNEEVSLEPGANATIDVEVPTDETDAGDRTVSVETANDTAETTVSLTEATPADFNVSALGTTDVRGAGQSFNVSVDVENIGDEEGTRNVTVSYRGEVVYDQEQTLTAGQTKTIEIEIETETDEGGAQLVEVETGDDSAQATVTLGSPPPFFAVDVRESGSDTTAVPGQNITVVAEIENTGGDSGTQDVTVSADGEVVNTTTVEELSVDESRLVDFDIDTTGIDPGSLQIVVASEDASDGYTVDIEEATNPTYVVDVTSVRDRVDEPASGETNIIVEADVENVGQTNGSQDIVFRVDGESRATVEDVELAGTAAEAGETTDTVTTEVPIERGDAPSVDVTVASDDDTDSETVEVTALPRFAVTTIDIPNRVTATEEFEPDVTIKNVGGRQASASVGLYFNGTSVGTVETSGDVSDGNTKRIENAVTLNASEVGLEDGTTTQVEANVTNGETDEVDDFSTARLAVSENEPADFRVNSLDLAGDVSGGEVVAGESVEIDAEIENTGEETGSQTVVLEFSGRTVAAETITLDGGDVRTVEATYNTRSGDVGDAVEVSSTTDDDTNTDEVDVLDPAEFDVEVSSVDESVIAGEELEANVRVENVGEADGEADLSVFLNGDNVTRSLELDGGDSTIESVTFEPDASQAGDRDIVAATTDAVDTTSVSIGTPGELAVSFASVPENITSEEPFNATVRVENVGDGEATGTVEFDADGLDDSTDVTLAGGESSLIELADAEVPAAGTEVNVTAEVTGTDAMTSTRTVSIVEPPESPTFAFSGVGTDPVDGTVLEPSAGKDTSVTFNATVRNVGDQEGTQSVDLVIGDETVASTGTLTLAGSATTDISLEYTVDDETPVGELDAVLRSENRTATTTITVEEATPAELTIDEIDRVGTGDLSTGDDLTADVTVENVGDRDLSSGTIELNMTGTEASTEASVDVDAGETETVEITVEIPDDPRAGTFDREFAVAVGSDEIDTRQTFTELVDYGTVQSGVAQAEPDDIVRIAPETYLENTITVGTENVTLRGVGDDRPTITPVNGETAVETTASDVTLERLVLAGNGVETGVVAEGSTTLQSVEIDDWTTGIESIDGEMTVLAVEIENVDDGIVLDSDEASEVAYSTIRASDTGVTATAPDVTLRDSAVAGAGTGVDLLGVTEDPLELRRTTLRENTIGFRALDVPEDELEVTIDSSNLESNELSVLADNSTIDATDNWWGQANGATPGDTLARSGIDTGDPLDTRVDSQFEVSIDDTDEITDANGNLVRGDSYTVPVTIDNTGSQGDTQAIELAVTNGPTPPTQDVAVAAGESEPAEFTLAVNQQFDDSIDLKALSLDAESGVKTLDVVSFDGIELSAGTSTLEESDTTQLSIEQTFSDDSTLELDDPSQADFESNDTAVATVTADGTVTAESTGTVAITAEYERAGTTVTDIVALAIEPQSDDDDGPSGGGDDDDDDRADDDDDDGTDDSAGEDDESPAPPASLEGLDVTATEVVVPQNISANQRVAEFVTVANVDKITFNTTDRIDEVQVSDINPANGTVETLGSTLAVQDITVSGNSSNTSATIEFTIPRDRLDEVEATPEELRTFRTVDGEFEPLNTTVEEANETVAVTAETPGFSVFTVSAVSEPEAVIDIAPDTIQPGDTVELSANGSENKHGEITSYNWSAGGDTLTGETAQTTFDEAGEYTVELTVTNDAGESNTTTANLVVEAVDDGTDDDSGDDDGATGDDTAGDGATGDDTAGDEATGDDTAGDGATDDDGQTDDGIPGFGVIVALIALIAAAGIAASRRS